ncbi:MAG: hypothetical protein ACI4XE_08890 [Acutalibacteraceae bacterium]
MVFLCWAVFNGLFIAVKEGEAFNWISIVFSLLLIAAFSVLFPYGYRFDENGAEILYLFGHRETFRWSQVKMVMVEREQFVPLWLEGCMNNYVFYGLWERKSKDASSINKNRKTKRLIEKYYGIKEKK